MDSPGANRPIWGISDAGPDVPSTRVEGIEAIRRELAAGHPIWIDIEAPTPWDIEQIHLIFPFHPLALEDVHHAVQRPKIEEYEEHLFLTAYGCRTEPGGEFTPLEVNAFVGKGYLVTFHDEPVPAISEVAQKCSRGRLALDRGSGFLLHAVLDGLVDSCFPILDAFDEEIDRIQEARTSRTSRRALDEIFEMRKRLLRFRRIIHPHIEVLGHLATKENDYISRTVRAYFRDVYDHVLRILDATDSSREILDTAVDTYLSQATENTNQVVKTVTVIATLGLPLTVLTGFFGMNFDHMAVFHHPLGVLVFFGLAIGIEGFLLVLFRRKGWL
jgi:magnesium transporter